MAEIWTVTVFDKLELPEGLDKESYSDLMTQESYHEFFNNHFGDIWTCALLEEEKLAFLVVEENITDIQETSYQYAVIEKYKSGLYPTPEEFYLYKWDGHKFVRMEDSPLHHIGFQGFTWR